MARIATHIGASCVLLTLLQFATCSPPFLKACRSYKEERSGLEGEILPERTADQHEFPHLAVLGYNVSSTEGVSWLCAGTLISDQFVLTAAHCCSNRASLKPVRVRLGVNNLTATADGNDYEISEIVLHPSYRVPQYHSDIALLKLDRKVKFSDAIFPACMSTEEGEPSSFTAVGWKAIEPTGTPQNSMLVKTTIYPVALTDCNNIFKRKFPTGLDSSVICAGNPQETTYTCDDYSGGPLVTGRAAPYTVVGISSVGPRHCGATILYPRVSHYLDWIESTVWPQRGSR